MQKRGLLLTFIISFALINLVSAIDSLGDIFDGLEASTVILGALFIIFFAVIHYSLSKTFKDKQGRPNTTISAIISFCISLLIVFGVHKTGIDYENFVYDIGISGGFLTSVGPWLFLIILAFLFWALKSKALLLLAALSFAIAITDWTYDDGMLVGIGVSLIVVWVIWKFVRKFKFIKKRTK